MPAKKLVKGSKTAKDFMKKLRAMRSVGSKPKSAPTKPAKKVPKKAVGGSFTPMGRRVGGASSEATLLQRLKQLKKIVEGKQL